MARNMRDLSFATFNLLNLQVPGGLTYSTTPPFPDDAEGRAAYARKIGWCAGIVRQLEAEVIAFQELWSRAALVEVFEAAGLADAYDIVCNGNEIGGGSIRIHRRDLQERVFAMMGISHDEAADKFGFLLDAFTFGAPPHGGLAFGWDRIVALLAGVDSIREVIAFPKSGGGVDPLTDAPAPITAQQRKESGIDAKPEASKKP